MPGIELRTAQNSVTICSVGYELCTVRRPSLAVELSLERHYERSVRANATAFTNELLESCVVPRRRAAEIAALPELRRARLRRALIAVCELGTSWRALYGSYMTPDERLLAVMVWRHEQQLDEMRAVWKLARRRKPASRITAHSRARTAGVIASLRAADARRRTRTGSVDPLGKVAKHLFDYSRFSSSMFPDLSKTIVGQVVAAQSATALKARVTAESIGLKRASLVPTATVASLGVRRAAALAAVPKTELSTSLLGTIGRGKPPPWQTLDKAVSGLIATQNLQRVVADVVRQGQMTKLALGPLSGPVGVASLASRMARPAFSFPNVGGQFRRFLDPLGEWRETLEEAGSFARQWQQTALWFLLSGLGFSVSRRLGSLDKAEVEAVVLDALESVIADGEFVPALRQAVAEAPHLTETQRIHLDHTLEHAVEGRYVHASAPLYVGLEGAFWEVAYVRAVVTLERKRLDNPNKDVGFETMVKALGLEQEFATFMVLALYGTTGNPYRHGGATTNERRQVLFGVAALSGWLQQFADVPALNALGSGMSAALPAAIERARGHVPALPSGA